MATKQPPKKKAAPAAAVPQFRVDEAPKTIRRGGTYRMRGSGEDGWCLCDGFTKPDAAGHRHVLLSFIGGDMPGFQNVHPATVLPELEERLPVL